IADEAGRDCRSAPPARRVACARRLSARAKFVPIEALMLTDLRAAVRALLLARGFTLLAIVTLATGIALCVTVLAVMNAYLIRSLPYPAADRLYRLDLAAPGQTPPKGLEHLDWHALDDVLESQISWDLDVFYVLGSAAPSSPDAGF